MDKTESLLKKLYESPYLCVVVDNTIKNINENMFDKINVCYLFNNFSSAIRFKNKLKNGDLLFVEKNDYINLFSLFLKINAIRVFMCHEINEKFQRLQISPSQFLFVNHCLPKNDTKFNCSRTINFQLINDTNETELKKVISNIISNTSNIESILNTKDFEFNFLVYHKFKTLLQKKKGESIEKSIKEILTIIQKILFFKLFTINKLFIPVFENDKYFYETINGSTCITLFLHQIDAHFYASNKLKDYKIKTVKFYSFIDLLDELKNQHVSKININIKDEQVTLPLTQESFIDSFGATINKTNIDLAYLNNINLYEQKPIVIIFNGKPEIDSKIHVFFTKKSYDLWIRRYKLNGSAVTETAQFEKVVNYLENNNCKGICMFGLVIPKRRMHHIYISKKDVKFLAK